MTAPPDRRAIITEALRKIDDLTARLAIAEQGDTEPIAVVGVGCRLPGGVNSAAQYWQLLESGGDGVVRVPADRWDADAFYAEDHSAPGTICSRDGGFLTSWHPSEFDAEFFGISPREAAAMDPQQRLLLEVGWEALEHAGITAPAIRGSRTSVFVGLTTDDYSILLGKLPPEDIDPHVPFGNAPNFAAGRLSYFLGVHGPAVVLDTACSSSLVTVHLACQSLRRRESDQALAAGVNLILSPENSIATSRWGMLAPDGRCKTFDAGADGYVRSEGCGVVVLKRLSDAVRDGDSVLAVVRGSAVNQDGPSSGQTVPNGPAQQAVLRAALAASRLEPADIDYIEAHGTGTALGDPIELGALAEVFGDRGGGAPLVLGSVKTNVGHLESAAGIAGFIKTVLCVQRGYIPAHLHFERLTPHAVAGASRFEVAAQGRAWPSVSRARRAGVSSFGVSGTNAHVVIEQAPVAESVARQPEPVVSTLVVSGKTPQRVAATAAMLAQWLGGAGVEVPLAEVAHTLAHHRTRYRHFAAVSARDRAAAVTGLQALAVGESAPGVVQTRVTPALSGRVFVYSGQGSQWSGMGQRLLAEEPAFAAAIEELEPVFVEQVGYSLRQILAESRPVTGDAQVQPVLMGLQLALTALWGSYGVKPDAVIGHSMGEVTAAVVAGALTPAQGLRVIAVRSQLMSRLAGLGAVALLELDAEASAELIAGYGGVELAGYVSPRQTVVAGPPEQVDAVIAAVAARERFARRVNMEVASHTALMDPILPELRTALGDLTPKAPTIPFFSTIAETTAPTLDADYWVDNLRQPVRFTQAVAMAGRDHGTFIEISPHPVMTHAVTETLESAEHHSVGTLWRDNDDTVSFHTGLNSVRTDQSPDLPHPPEPHPVLPSTPWQHARHWITVQTQSAATASTPKSGTLLGADHIDVATTPPTRLWQARLSPETKPYPGSHTFGDGEVVPAAVVLHTLLAAAAEYAAAAVTDVRLELPIAVDQPRIVQVVADGDALTVSSSPAAYSPDYRWVRHGSARITRQPNPLSDATVAGERELSSYPAAVEAELQRVWGTGGLTFKWSVSDCRSGPGRLSADVEFADGSTAAVLDAVVQLARLVDSSNAALMLPATADDVWTAGDLGDGHGVVDVRRRAGDHDELTVDIAVRAPDGAPHLHIRGLRYVALDPVGASTGSAGEDWTIAHALDWQPAEEHTGAAPAVDGTATLAVVGHGDSADALRHRFGHAGYAAADISDARYVLYVAEPGSPATETDLDCAVRLASEVAAVVGQLVQRDDGNPATLWILTRGVREAGSVAAVRQGCLWGVAGVIRAEQPQLWGGLVDLSDEDRIDACAATLATVLPTPAKSVLALRDGELLAPALVPVAGPPTREPLRCRPDAAYLITGGLGELGLLMAGWLADRGARRLILAGRTPLPPRREWDSDANDSGTRAKIAVIRALETRGVSVDAVALDVGSPDAVHSLLARRDEEGAPPVRGVIHAAGLTEAQLLTEVTDSRLRRTMWPKVAGAQVLNEAFPAGTLDFLFLIASAGTVFGVPGQGAYAAANAYLDSLARARHRQGCHTVSLDWVAWRGLGFAKDAEVVLHELERVGSRPVNAHEAFAAWEQLERYDVAQAVMAPLRSAQTDRFGRFDSAGRRTAADGVDRHARRGGAQRTAGRTE